MVGEDGEGVSGPSQIVPPVGESFHHGKQLSFIDVIIAFCGGEGGGVVCNGMEFRFSLFVGGSISFSSLLGEDHSNPVCRGVGL